MYIQNGRIADYDDYKLKTGLKEIAKVHSGEFRMTGNQNVIIANVSAQKKKQINELIEQYGLTDGKHYSALRRSSLACVAFPTCGLAMAEAERYLPELLTKIEEIIDENGLREKEINIRMTGCPNGCARPGFRGNWLSWVKHLENIICILALHTMEHVLIRCIVKILVKKKF